nr:hypothetical protein GCM10020093_081740 [Planobispora longispora]
MSLGRNPEAPARSIATTYSSRSNVLNPSTRTPGRASVISWVAATPSTPGMCTSISTTSGRRSRLSRTASALRGLAGDGHVGLGIEDHAEPGAHHGVVVDEQNLDH